VNASDEVALTYNDTSVLENFHISQAFRILREYNFLSSLDKKTLLEFRETCIKLVLATDMMFHFSHTKELKQLIDLNTEVHNCNNSDNKVINFSSILTSNNKLMIMKMLVHMCDISNPLKNEKLS